MWLGLTLQVQAQVPSGDLRNAGPEPQRFTVAEGQLYNVSADIVRLFAHAVPCTES